MLARPKEFKSRLTFALKHFNISNISLLKKKNLYKLLSIGHFSMH